MQGQKRIISLLIVVLLTMIIVTIAASRRESSRSSQEQNLLNQKNQSDQKRAEMRSRFPIVDYTDSHGVTADPDKAIKRQIKSRRYDNYRWVKSQPNPDIDETVVHTDWGSELSAIPVTESDAVIIGEVSSMEAHLSNDKSGVYSEFAVQINEALKKKSSISVTAENTLVVERPGGIVKYSDNHTRLYRFQGKGMPRVGGRYVLFLSLPNSEAESNQNYVIITGYEIYMDKIIPLDDLRQFAVFDNSTEEVFLAAVREAINKAK